MAASTSPATTDAKNKKIVADGYDQMYSKYETWKETVDDPHRKRWIDMAIHELKSSATPNSASSSAATAAVVSHRALDLGCSTGKLATVHLIDCGLFDEVTGLDLSPLSIAAARKYFTERTPPSSNSSAAAVVSTKATAVKWLTGDMMSASFPPQSFQLITAFFSIIHLPRSEHSAMISRIAEWLTTGGLFVGTMSGAAPSPTPTASSKPATTSATDAPTFLAVPMFWDNFDGDTNLKLLTANGRLTVLKSYLITVVENDHSVTFLWFMVRKVK